MPTGQSLALCGDDAKKLFCSSCSGEPHLLGDTSVKATPSEATKQCQRSIFARDEARWRQERATSIANLIKRSFKGSNLVLSRQPVQVLCFPMHNPRGGVSRFWKAYVYHSF